MFVKHVVLRDGISILHRDSSFFKLTKTMIDHFKIILRPVLNVGLICLFSCVLLSHAFHPYRPSEEQLPALQQRYPQSDVR